MKSRYVIIPEDPDASVSLLTGVDFREEDPDPPCDKCGDVCCGCYADEAAAHDAIGEWNEN